MRILYLVTKADMGGAQVHLLDLVRGFRGELDPIVAAGEEGYLTAAVRKLGVPCHVVPSLVHPISPLKDGQAVIEVSRLIRAVRADLIHAHTSKAGLIGRLAARVTRTPAVFTAHTWCFAEGTSWKWRVAGLPAERLAGWFSSAIINVSEANQQLALRHGISGEKRMLTIWNGIADTPYRARPDHEGEPRIVMVARFATQKDQLSLLRALSEIRHPAKLLFVGDGPTMEMVKGDCDRLGLQERVEFLGPRQDVAQILAKSQIFALATNWEGLPLSILEAMRAGLPAVVSDVGGVSEAVIDGQTGFLARRGDVEGLRHRLTRLLTDPGLRVRLGKAARARYENHFTLDRMLRKTLAVYHMAALGVRAANSLPLRQIGVHADFRS